MSQRLLSLRQMRAGYGDAVVLDDISLDVPEHGSLAVLGRNGVGKSTLLLSIMGYTEVSRGQVLWRGKDITGMQPHRRARAGLGTAVHRLVGFAAGILIWKFDWNRPGGQFADEGV